MTENNMKGLVLLATAYGLGLLTFYIGIHLRWV